MAALLAALTLSASARAEARVALHAEGGGRGPIHLAPKDGALVGAFDVVNEGDAPLVVSRVAVRGGPDDVRSPPRVRARLEGSGSIAPGGRARVVVTYAYERDPRVTQALGHVVVTTSDEARGELAMGFEGHVPRPLGWLRDRLLSLVVLVPFAFAALVAVVGRAAGRGARAAHVLARVGAALQLALAAWAYREVMPGLTRADGNDGLQLVERSAWVRALGAEYFVGVDGLSAALVLLVALVSACALWGSPPAASAGARAISPSGRASAHLVCAGALAGVFVAIDLALFLFMLAVALGAACVLVASPGTPDSVRAAARVALVFVLAWACVAAAIFLLRARAGPIVLVDGTRASGFSLPELARVDFRAKPGVFGVSPVKVAWTLALVGFGALGTLVPGHVWWAETCAPGRSSASALLVLVTTVGPYGMARVAFGLLPHGARWAATTLVAVGVATLLYAALVAWAQRDARRLVAFSATAQAGLCFAGLGALTPEALEGAAVLLFARGLVVPLALLALDAGDVRDLHGVPQASLPRGLVALLGAALAAAPGTVGFWGAWLVVAGALPRTPVLGLAAGAGWVLLAGAQVMHWRRRSLGDGRETARADDPPGEGERPRLAPRAWVPLVPLALLVLTLGVWPTPLVATLSGAVVDLANDLDPAGPLQISARPPVEAPSPWGSGGEANMLAETPCALSRSRRTSSSSRCW